jgi:hypothetical protein
VVLAAAPDWYANHVPQVTIGALVVVAALFVWLIQQVVLRVAVLAVFAALALFVYANRLPLERCARTCECRVAGANVTVPLCHHDDGS